MNEERRSHAGRLQGAGPLFIRTRGQLEGDWKVVEEKGQRPAHEQIDEPEHVPLLAEDGLEARDIDPRHRDMRPQPEDRQHADRFYTRPA